MTYQPAQSPWDSVNNPPENVQEYYGEASINAWWCMLSPGQGKLPYDEKTIDPKTGEAPRRYTAVDVMVNPLAECGLQYDLKRTLLAEFGDWKETTWPSLKALGVMNAQAVTGQYARVEMIPTGRKYTGQDGNEKTATAIKFVALYPTREACLAAWQGANGHTAPVQATLEESSQPNAERETALKFALVFVKNAVRAGGGDLDKINAALAPMLAGQKLIAKYFTVESPEIVDAILQESK
jgi:hypothetical protein